MKKLFILFSLLAILTACPAALPPEQLFCDIDGLQMKETENDYVFSWEPIDFSGIGMSDAKRTFLKKQIDYRFFIGLKDFGDLVSDFGMLLMAQCGDTPSVTIAKDRIPPGRYTVSVSFQYKPVESISMPILNYSGGFNMTINE